MSAVYADGAMHGTASVPSAAASRRQDGGSPCGRAGARPSWGVSPCGKTASCGRDRAWHRYARVPSSDCADWVNFDKKPNRLALVGQLLV